MKPSASRRTLRPLRSLLAPASLGLAIAFAAACSGDGGSTLPPTPPVLSRSYILVAYNGGALPHAASQGTTAGTVVADTVRVWTNGSITGVSYFQGATGSPTALRMCEGEGTVIAPPFGTVDFGTVLGRGTAGEDTVRLTSGTDYFYGKGQALTYVRISEGTDPAFVCQ